jgi:hypothetical protein
MRLLSQELRESLPSLGAQRGANDPMVYAKFWIPDVGWIWYVTEGEHRGNNFIFFGYVLGEDEEWEEFSLRDLEAIRSPEGGRVERDLDFQPTQWRNIEFNEDTTSS